VCVSVEIYSGLLKVHSGKDNTRTRLLDIFLRLNRSLKGGDIDALRIGPEKAFQIGR
jgi:hypothetical protein